MIKIHIEITNSIMHKPITLSNHHPSIHTHTCIHINIYGDIYIYIYIYISTHLQTFNQHYVVIFSPKSPIQKWSYI